jgi:hypothetical protein
MFNQQIIIIIIIIIAIGLTPGGSSTAHIYTQTVHTIQQYITHLHTNSTHNTVIVKLGSAGRAGRAPSCK